MRFRFGYFDHMNIPISHYRNFQRRVPPGDSLERLVCDNCEWVHYENPRIIATALCVHDSGILFCRRAIRPRYGFWTFPGGFMENGETAEEACQREAREEACADIALDALLGIYSIPHIGQVHLVWLASLTSSRWAAGPESLDVAIMPLDGIPWEELAFPVNRWALNDYLSLNGESVSQPFTTRPDQLDERLPTVDVHPDFAPPADP